MKPTRTLFGSALLVVWLILARDHNTLHASSQPLAANTAGYQLLANPGMEVYDVPYSQFHGVNCQVASHWQRFWYGSPEPCWMDTEVFADSDLGGGWVERIEGETSQMILSTQPYTAGLWQRVGGLTPGLGYGFHAAMLTIFQTSAQEPVDGTMIKQVGIDPTGGTDPQASTVVWSDADDHDQGPWDIRRRTAVFAQGDTMTVFIRVISPYGAGSWPLLNLSFLDSAILAQTATVAAVSPDVSLDPTFIVSWNNAVPSPGGQIRWYDVQWMDEGQGTWNNWFEQTTQVQSTFTGQRGHTYRFRARAWQRYPNGAHLYSPYRSPGDTQTYIKGPELVGHVLSNEGHTVTGATVSLWGTPYAATSGSDGSYRIRFLPSSEPQIAVLSHPFWPVPAPVYNLTFEETETVTFDWALRPPDDSVVNGGFEDGLQGWTPTGGPGPVPQAVASPIHTGQGALALGGVAGLSSTVGVAQAAALAHAWEPALAFWYRTEAAGPGDHFNVVLTVGTQPEDTAQPVAQAAGRLASPDLLLGPEVTTTHVFTPPLDVAGWQHLALYPLSEAYYTGTVTISFQVWNDGQGAVTTVHLDEVSLGRTAGGPHRTFLPMILRGF